MNFDALDYFQAQKAQERTALRLLDEARQEVDASRSRLEQTESQLIMKKRIAAESRRKLATLYSTAILADQVDLVQKRTELALTVEQTTMAKAEMIQNLLNQLESELETNSHEASVEQAGFEAAMKMLEDAQSRVMTLHTSKEDLQVQLQGLQATINALKIESSIWQEKENVAKDDLVRLKEEIAQMHVHTSRLEKETEVSLATANQLWSERVSNAEQELKQNLDALMKQRQQAQDQNEVEAGQLLDSIRLCEDQINQARERESLQNSKLEQIQSGRGLLVKQIAGESPSELDALLKQLEEEQESVRILRESVKPEEQVWEERQKLEEANFLPMYAKLIDPKRDELLGLKRNLREAEEANAKIAEEFKLKMQHLENKIAELRKST